MGGARNVQRAPIDTHFFDLSSLEGKGAMNRANGVSKIPNHHREQFGATPVSFSTW